MKSLTAIVFTLCIIFFCACEEGTLYPAKDGNKWGYINENGKFIIKAQYDYAEEFKGDIAMVITSHLKEVPMTPEEIENTKTSGKRIAEGIGKSFFEITPKKLELTKTVSIQKHSYINKSGKIIRSWEEPRGHD